MGSGCARWLVALLWLAACNSGDDDSQDAATAGSSGGTRDAGVDAGADDCADVPAFAEVAIFDECIACHGTDVTGDDREGAPSHVNFDDYDSAVAAAERAAQYVMQGIMPPPGSGIAVSEQEKQQLYTWVQCGTPD